MTDTLGGQVRASALASVVGAPSPPRLTLVKNVDVPPTRDATFFFSLWLQRRRRAEDDRRARPGRSGHDPGRCDQQRLGRGDPAPVAVRLHLGGDPRPRLRHAGPRARWPRWMCATPLTGVVDNTRAVGTIEVTKVVEGPTVGASATATVVVDCARRRPTTRR